MKKNLFGFVALVLAIGFSAFTTIPGSKKTSGTPYFWYELHGGTNTVGSTINPDEAVDKETAMSNLTLCNDQTPVNCLYGSTNPNLPNGTSIGTPAADQLIRERP